MCETPYCDKCKVFTVCLLCNMPYLCLNCSMHPHCGDEDEIEQEIIVFDTIHFIMKTNFIIL